MNAPRRPAQMVSKRRLPWTLGGLALCALSLIGTAFSMQVLHRDFYQDQGDARFLRDVKVAAARGMISDRSGEPLAISTPMISLWAEPKALLTAGANLQPLAQALGRSLKALQADLQSHRSKEFYYLRRLLPPEQAERLLALKLPGLNGQREYRRYYPGGEVFAHVIGTTNVDGAGIEGLESGFDRWLVGSAGSKRVIRDRRGETVENVEEVRATEPGKELRLSLDRRLQYLAYRELKAAILEYGAQSGSMVILDVATGEILAMVNAPSFNPNARSQSDAGNRRNRAVTDTFEPGSVIKAFTVAAGLESGRFTTATQINTHPGTLVVGNHLVRDIHDYGVIDLTRLLTKSSNVGATRIALALDDDHFYDVFQRFGFGLTTGSGFPGEVTGNLPAPKGWGQVEKATLSYGYGLSVTALQLATAYATLANAGVRHTPTFIKGAPLAEREQPVLDPAIAKTLLGMLETVTGPDGTAIRARVTNYRVAGKSGTARKSAVGGYGNRYLSVFAGLIPVSRPRLAAVVVIHDPIGSVYYGGLVAAPVFGKVMSAAMRQLNIAPDDLQPGLLAGSVPVPAGESAPADLAALAAANAAEGEPL